MFSKNNLNLFTPMQSNIYFCLFNFSNFTLRSIVMYFESIEVAPAIVQKVPVPSCKVKACSRVVEIFFFTDI